METRQSPQGPTLSVTADASGTLFVAGELDIATVPVLDDAIGRSNVDGRPLVLDLAGLTFLDSTGIRCIIRAWKLTSRPVVLRNPIEWVRSILDLAGADSNGAWVVEPSS